MSAYLPELQELPELQAANTRGLRLQDTLLKRMPAVADLSVQRAVIKRVAGLGSGAGDGQHQGGLFLFQRL